MERKKYHIRSSSHVGTVVLGCFLCGRCTHDVVAGTNHFSHFAVAQCPTLDDAPLRPWRRPRNSSKTMLKSRHCYCSSLSTRRPRRASQSLVNRQKTTHKLKLYPKVGFLVSFIDVFLVRLPEMVAPRRQKKNAEIPTKCINEVTRKVNGILRT